jgi:hypothetical protein
MTPRHGENSACRFPPKLWPRNWSFLPDTCACSTRAFPEPTDKLANSYLATFHNVPETKEAHRLNIWPLWRPGRGVDFRLAEGGSARLLHPFHFFLFQQKKQKMESQIKLVKEYAFQHGLLNQDATDQELFEFVMNCPDEHQDAMKGLLGDDFKMRWCNIL